MQPSASGWPWPRPGGCGIEASTSLCRQTQKWCNGRPATQPRAHSRVISSSPSWTARRPPQRDSRPRRRPSTQRRTQRRRRWRRRWTPVRWCACRPRPRNELPTSGTESALRSRRQRSVAAPTKTCAPMHAQMIQFQLWVARMAITDPARNQPRPFSFVTPWMHASVRCRSPQCL